MMGLARLPLSRLPGLVFWKLCGSGTGEGFTPRPNTSVWAVLCVWEDMAAARHGLDLTQPFTWYHKHSAESWTVFLRPISARGAWSQQSPFHVCGTLKPHASVATLTRATLKPKILLRFWQQVPDISRMIGENTDVEMKIGLGEVPYLHQITFSIWPDLASMARFAREPGPHAEAIKAVRDGRWFREELYARFEILGESGQWNGKHPVAPQNAQDKGS